MGPRTKLTILATSGSQLGRTDSRIRGWMFCIYRSVAFAKPGSDGPKMVVLHLRTDASSCCVWALTERFIRRIWASFDGSTSPTAKDWTRARLLKARTDKDHMVKSCEMRPTSGKREYDLDWSNCCVQREHGKDEILVSSYTRPNNWKTLATSWSRSSNGKQGAQVETSHAQSSSEGSRRPSMTHSGHTQRHSTPVWSRQTPVDVAARLPVRDDEPRRITWWSSDYRHTAHSGILSEQGQPVRQNERLWNWYVCSWRSIVRRRSCAPSIRFSAPRGDCMIAMTGRPLVVVISASQLMSLAGSCGFIVNDVRYHARFLSRPQKLPSGSS